jgi:hypothetical protein
MKKILLLIVAIAGAGVILAQNGKPKTTNARKDSTANMVYTCTMHPEIISAKPGDCPKCGMTLVKKYVATLYQCPMDPEVISDKPGKCPKCGMDLEKKKSSAMQKDTMHKK